MFSQENWQLCAKDVHDGKDVGEGEVGQDDEQDSVDVEDALLEWYFESVD